MKTIRRWMSLALVVCLLAMLPAPALMEGVEAGTGFPVDGEVSASTSAAEDETITSPSPSASAAAEGESITSPSPSASTAAEGETITSPSPSAETSSASTDAAEGRTIASFEAVAPEGLSAPQGTPETGLGLPASLNVQFSDGAVGEILVTWQCAAGYDPNAEVGMQFTFAAVLPQGYALSEGVSLPEILVTLTPPLANAMLAARASGDGWTYDEATGILTVTFSVSSSRLTEVPFNNISIVIDGGSFTNYTTLTNCTIKVLDGSFKNQSNGKTDGCTVTVESDQEFTNRGTVSGGSFTTKSKRIVNTGTISSCAITAAQSNLLQNSGNISGGSLNITVGGFENNGSISNCDIDVSTNDSFENYNMISGGTLDIIQYGASCSNYGTLTGDIAVFPAVHLAAAV